MKELLTNPRKIVKSKTELIDQFTGNTATRWGNIFEPITNMYTEYIFDLTDAYDIMDLPDEMVCEITTRIIESNGLTSPVRGQVYSPDGIAVIKLDGKYKIVLFEFKAPYSRIPGEVVPDEYCPQIQTGMVAAPITEQSIYVSNCYRKCKWVDLVCNNVYDTEFHCSDSADGLRGKKLSEFYDISENLPHAAGIIMFYTSADYIDRFKPARQPGDIGNIIGQDLCDFGDPINNNFINMLFILYDERKVSAEYIAIYNNDIINELEYVEMHNLTKPDHDFDIKGGVLGSIQRINDKHLSEHPADIALGFMPWKLMKSLIADVERDSLWRNKIELLVNTTVDNIQKIIESDDLRTRCQTYNELYNDRHIIQNTGNIETTRMVIHVEED